MKKINNWLDNTIPIPVFLGIFFSFSFLLFFYINYAQNSWFYQDDFWFIKDYANTIQLNQLFEFTNFGRFVSRNLYWYFGIKFFSFNAQFFYLFNFFVIFSTSYILFRIFSKRGGYFYGLVAGLFYFILPATIESYAWLSNSQHIIAHFFIILFVYLYINRSIENSFFQKITWLIIFSFLLIAGLLSNIFMAMVLSLPLWMAICDNHLRKSKSNYFIIIFGAVTFTFFVYKLRGNQVGPYLTSYSIETVLKNTQFYFLNNYIFALWFVSCFIGTLYSYLNKKFFIAWLFIASIVFFIPFMFLVFQRYSQYGVMTYLFFLLGSWALLYESFGSKFPILIQYVGVLLLLLLFSRSLEPSIRYYSENNKGRPQKNQIEYLSSYDRAHPEIHTYCFRSQKEVVNNTGVKVWDIPGEWWGVGFGDAFKIFVNPAKRYELVSNAVTCDVTFIFKDGKLSTMTP